ncbi:thioredoxin-like protein [Polychytrium aggregatum]|uniref:thioredoxin-like protein n=1 Tax=Polychytrium aggregatum TaxID=110093 RepID=UPI0022FEE155|nr:thioredoxin-like protein [Polychytrium aggregatum]KAI9205379.1 thioredoxin-like protein [Polychytrium aggregatum]
MANPSEDTEWNDILREKGILPPKEPEFTEDDIVELVEKAVHEKYHGKSIEDRDLDELAELEDIEDDRVLESYRRQRLAEMQAVAAKEKFGQVLQITKPDYTVEITEASKDAWVVLHLFQDYLPHCRLLNAHLATLAAKHRAIKFCKIVADQCIPNYPDRNCPTFLIYGRGDLQAQIVGIDKLGGLNARVEDVERVLVAVGALDLSKVLSAKKKGGNGDDDDDDIDPDRKIRSGFTRASKSNNRSGDDDDDWD